MFVVLNFVFGRLNIAMAIIAIWPPCWVPAFGPGGHIRIDDAGTNGNALENS